MSTYYTKNNSNDIHYTKNNSADRYYTKSDSDNRYYNKTQSDYSKSYCEKTSATKIGVDTAVTEVEMELGGIEEQLVSLGLLPSTSGIFSIFSAGALGVLWVPNGVHV